MRSHLPPPSPQDHPPQNPCVINRNPLAPCGCQRLFSSSTAFLPVTFNPMDRRLSGLVSYPSTFPPSASFQGNSVYSHPFDDQSSVSFIQSFIARQREAIALLSAYNNSLSSSLNSFPSCTFTGLPSRGAASTLSSSSRLLPLPSSAESSPPSHDRSLPTTTTVRKRKPPALTEKIIDLTPEEPLKAVLQDEETTEKKQKMLEEANADRMCAETTPKLTECNIAPSSEASEKLIKYSIQPTRYLTQRQMLASKGYSAKQCDALLLREASQKIVKILLEKHDCLIQPFGHDRLTAIAARRNGGCNLLEILAHQAWEMNDPCARHVEKLSPPQLTRILCRINGRKSLAEFRRHVKWEEETNLPKDKRLSSSNAMEIFRCDNAFYHFTAFRDYIKWENSHLIPEEKKLPHQAIVQILSYKGGDKSLAEYRNHIEWEDESDLSLERMLLCKDAVEILSYKNASQNLIAFRLHVKWEKEVSIPAQRKLLYDDIVTLLNRPNGSLYLGMVRKYYETADRMGLSVDKQFSTQQLIFILKAQKGHEHLNIVVKNLDYFITHPIPLRKLIYCLGSPPERKVIIDQIEQYYAEQTSTSDTMAPSEMKNPSDIPYIHSSTSTPSSAIPLEDLWPSLDFPLTPHSLAPRANCGLFKESVKPTRRVNTLPPSTAAKSGYGEQKHFSAINGRMFQAPDNTIKQVNTMPVAAETNLNYEEEEPFSKVNRGVF